MRPQIIVQHGIAYRLDSRGFFYDPIEPADERYPFPGLILIALAIAAWGLVFGIGWCVFRIIEILVS